MKVLQKKTGFHRNFKKGLPLLGEVSAHAVREHQHHQDPLLQQAKNTKIAELQICKKHKDCRIANLQMQMQIFQKNANLQKSPKSQKWQQNTIIIERGQMQRFSIVSSSRRHQTLSHSGSNRETGSVNLTKSPSPPAAHLLTPPPASPIVTATNL